MSTDKQSKKPDGKKRHLPFIEHEYFDAVNAIRKSHGLTWNDVFKRFKLYGNGLEYIFQAPDEMTKQLRLDLNTVMGLVPLWIDNIRLNWTSIHEGKTVEDLMLMHEGKAAITIGAGHSLKTRKHLEYISQLPDRDNYIIISTAHSLIECLKNGVIPDFCSFVDASDMMLDFLDDPLVDEHADKIKMVFCASTHPSVIARWPGKDNYYFLSGIPQNIVPNVDTFISTLLPDLPEMDSGGNSGTFCVSLGIHLGCKTIAMVGMDLSHPAGHPHSDTQYYKAYCQSIGNEYKDVKDMVDKCYTDYHHPVFGTDAYFDFVYEVFRDSLYSIAEYYKETGLEIINCTEGGIIGNEDILCMRLEQFVSRGD